MKMTFTRQEACRAPRAAAGAPARAAKRARPASGETRARLRTVDFAVGAFSNLLHLLIALHDKCVFLRRNEIVRNTSER